MKRASTTLFLVLAISIGLFVGLFAAQANATGQPKTTICHPVASATGGNTHAGYSIITTANPSVHIDEETGEPKHEHDGRVDFVVTEGTPCPPVTQEETSLYRVVAGMPRYRGEVFEASTDLVCTSVIDMPSKAWSVDCEGHLDSGSINSRYRTYVRVREVGVPGPYQVILDLR